MEIIGYIGFLILVFFAVMWTIGIRLKLDLGVPTIIGALFFMISVIVLGLGGYNKLHSYWLIVVGFALVPLLGFIGGYFRPIFEIFRLISSIYSGIIRIGIPKEKIKAAQDLDLKQQIEEFSSKMEKKKQDKNK